MALKAIIFKVELKIADIDRNYYADHALTLARHPSETDERMMVRLLAFALNASDALQFGPGLSSEDEPDLVEKDLTGQIELWIDVGLPDGRSIRKACGRAKEVKVFAYGGRAASLWYEQNRDAFERLANLSVVELPAEATRALGAMAQRSMRLQFTIQDGLVWIDDGNMHVQVQPAQRRP